MLKSNEIQKSLPPSLSPYLGKEIANRLRGFNPGKQEGEGGRGKMAQ